MPDALTRRRGEDVLYASRWVGPCDAEDIVHDAYETAIRRRPARTSIRLAIKQHACALIATRRRGWAGLADPDESIACGEALLDERFDDRAWLRRADLADVVAVVDCPSSSRAPSRKTARQLRRARRRISQCKIANC